MPRLSGDAITSASHANAGRMHFPKGPSPGSSFSRKAAWAAVGYSTPDPSLQLCYGSVWMRLPPNGNSKPAL